MRTILIGLFFSLGIFAQVQNTNIVPVASDPTGQVCSATSIRLLTPNGNIYTCVSGIYALAANPSASPSGTVIICSGSSSATAATCPGVPIPTTLMNLGGTFIPGLTTTGTPFTLNIAGLGVKTVYLNGAVTSSTNTLTGGQPYQFYYDGTYIQVSGGSGGGYPKVVAKANYTGQTGNLSFDLLADPPTGDYVLDDYLTVVTPDASATLTYRASWADDQGATQAEGITPPVGGSASVNALSAAGFPGADYSVTAPTVIHAVTGTPIAVDITVIAGSGSILASHVTPGTYKGSGYSPGDTGTFPTGDGTATYTVLTVDGSGGILTFSATGGTTYPNRSSSSSVVVTGGGDGAFRAVLTAVAGVVTSGVVESNGGFDYAPGDTGTISTGSDDATYSVLTVDGNGAVLTYSLPDPGTAYSTGSGYGTAVNTGSGDGQFLIDITAVSTSLVYSYHATLTRNQ